MLFTIIEGQFVVLRQNGVFRQVQLYQYGNRIFAKFGNGYVGLRKPSSNNPTTKPDVTWLSDSLTIEHKFVGQDMVVTQ